MRPRGWPSPRVKVKPWYFPRRSNLASRGDEVRRVIRQDVRDTGDQEDPLRQDEDGI